MNRAEMLEPARPSGAAPWDMVVIGGGATGVGHRRRRGLARLRRAAPRAARLRQGHVEPQHQARARRRALPRAGQHLARDGGAQGARPPAPERAAPGRATSPSSCPNYDWWEAPFYGVGLKVYNLLAGKYGFGDSRDPLARGDARAPADDQDRRAARRRRLLRRPVRRRAAAHQPGRRPRPSRARRSLNYAPVIGAHAGRATASWTASSRATSRAAARSAIRGAGRHQRRRARSATRCAAWPIPTRRPLIAPSQGIHLVFDRSFLPGRSAIMVPHTSDGRVMFAIPWHGHTARRHDRHADRRADARAAAASTRRSSSSSRRPAATCTRPPTRDDVLSVFVGHPAARPRRRRREHRRALARPHDPHRRHRACSPSTGGKWTTYRHMAEDCVNQAADAGAPAREALRDPDAQHPRLPPTRGAVRRRSRVYGSDAPRHPGPRCAPTRRSASRSTRRCPTRGAEVVWAARCEMARTVEDVLARRTRALFLNARAADMAPEVARLMAGELGWDASREAAEVTAFSALAKGYQL